MGREEEGSEGEGGEGKRVKRTGKEMVAWMPPALQVPE